MSRVFSINEVCERALRKIGVFSINDSAAPAFAMEEARWWLDMVVGHIAAKQRRWWLVPDTAVVTLVAGTSEYPVTTTLGAGEADGVMHLISAWRVSLTDPSDRVEVDIVRRRMWEEREGAGTTGLAEMIWVDRVKAAKIHLHHVPADPVSHRLEVVYHRFAPDLSPRAGRSHVALTGMRESWNLALVHALAAEIGNGPVRKLPGDEVKDMQATANRLMNDLDAYDAHEQANEPRRVEFFDGI
jgi:hypothetical protein